VSLQVRNSASDVLLHVTAVSWRVGHLRACCRVIMQAVSVLQCAVFAGRLMTLTGTQPEPGAGRSEIL